MANPFRRNAFDGRRRIRGATRTRLMLFPAFLFFVTGFFGTSADMLAGMAACGLIATASWITREGLRAEAAYDARTIARKPAIPRKLIGAGLTGLGIAAGALGGGGVMAILLAIVGAALHVASFGPDPLRDKGEGMEAGRVARAIHEAEAYLAEMVALAEGLGDRAITRRVTEFTVTARTLFRRVEDDPRDLPGVRRYLGVYLMGARDATAKLAEIERHDPDMAARHDYLALLSDLETDFASRTSDLMRNDRADLDVEISVLRERLMRE
ncbi:5-bromo-4-chloroindolyl phosphate hydrolysis family protein [Falsirhodobacter deserti]|uniref:5-bromo-4-chloroindolyl phosphate hydrolysis family protein n=1 Tax=Falsirhodobacter deserti TaxID=1365611 RepID=UPI000FE368DF|nr:5-bromo-4-chloroindolyl phosphate hydrolysis family protein [Falsirhodobacter deserti]